MLRKWSDQAVVWTEYGQYLFSQNKLESGRNLLQRALKTLPSKLRKNNQKCLILLFFSYLDNSSVMDGIAGYYYYIKSQ